MSAELAVDLKITPEEYLQGDMKVAIDEFDVNSFLCRVGKPTLHIYRSLLKEYPIVTVIALRQAGKTTLVRKVLFDSSDV